MKMKYQRDKLGNIYAIPLPSRKFAFGRRMADADIAIYKHIGDTIEDIPKEEKYQFIVGVYKNVLTCGEWPVVENRPFKNEEEAWPPPTFIWNQSTGKYNQYYKGQITPDQPPITIPVVMLVRPVLSLQAPEACNQANYVV